MTQCSLAEHNKLCAERRGGGQRNEEINCGINCDIRLRHQQARLRRPERDGPWFNGP